MSVVWLHKSGRWTKRKEALILYWRSDGINHTGITMITQHASNTDTEVVFWHSLALTCCLMVVLLGHFWAFGLAWPREIPSQKWCGKRSKWWSKSQVTGCPTFIHDNHAGFIWFCSFIMIFSGIFGIVSLSRKIMLKDLTIAEDIWVQHRKGKVSQHTWLYCCNCHPLFEQFLSLLACFHILHTPRMCLMWPRRMIMWLDIIDIYIYIYIYTYHIIYILI